MSDPVISVDGLSKRYIIAHQRDANDALRHRLEDAIRAPWRWLTTRDAGRGGDGAAGVPPREEFWALKDVSFDVQQGEMVGIIGRNGAGKSTLLKLLSRITEPTRGRICMTGRVASLLEVGAGFHQELTGRENIYLNGAILGMTRAEIKSKFDEIVAFSEVERFLDTPVKRYSSGMYVRLAFAVAAHLEPDILIVDEVLAVGDAAFQKKCLGKMGEVVGRQGRTVLFVSHNMTAVASLCSRAILLREGTIARTGPVGEVINSYLSSVGELTATREWHDKATAPGTEACRFRAARLVPDSVASVEQLDVNSRFAIQFEVWCLQPGVFNLSMEVRLLSGELACSIVSPALTVSAGDIAQYRCHVPGKLLNDETYIVHVMVVDSVLCQPLYRLADALTFDVRDVPRTSGWLGKWPGPVRPELQWTCQTSAPAAAATPVTIPR